MVKKAKKKKAAAKKPLKRKTAKAPMLAIPSFKGKYVWVNDLDQLWQPNGEGVAIVPGQAYVSPNEIRPNGCHESFQPTPAQDFLGYMPRFNELGDWVFEIVWAFNAMTLRSALKENKSQWRAVIHEMKVKTAQAIKNTREIEKLLTAKIRQAEKAALKWG